MISDHLLFKVSIVYKDAPFHIQGHGSFLKKIKSPIHPLLRLKKKKQQKTPATTNKQTNKNYNRTNSSPMDLMSKKKKNF